MNPDQFLSRLDVAALLGLSRRTLERWQKAGSGPLYYKFGNSVRYPWREMQAWVASCQRRRVSGGNRQGNARRLRPPSAPLPESR